MGLYDARFAVPGLMPVEPVKDMCRVEANADGSLFLCVHCGRRTDTVHYAVDVGGPVGRRGVLKDPSYDFNGLELYPSFDFKKKGWAQFMVLCDSLPEGCGVLNVPVHGTRAVPVTEVPCIPEKDRVYWVLCLPAEILPYGQSMLELCINGKVYKHAVTRPAFSIYSKDYWLMKKTRIYRNQRGETLDVAFCRNTGGKIYVSLAYEGFSGEYYLPDDAEYRAFAVVNGNDVPLECTVDIKEHELVVTVPDGLAEGKWTWRSEYMTWGNWSGLVCGDLFITQPKMPYKSVHRVRQYLYEVEYDCIDYDAAYEYFKSREVPAAAGACTSMVSGGVFGRNYDWMYDNGVEFIVRTKGDGPRRSVIGVSGRLQGLEDDFVASGEYSELYGILPFVLVDGVNSSGLAMSVNVVPAKDRGVNLKAYPSGEVEAEICTQMLIRYVLDRFDSASWAAEWIGRHAMLFTPAAREEMGYEHHFLIADAHSSWVVELVDNRVQVMNVGGDGMKPVITNFHIYGVTPNEDGTLYTPATGDAHESNGVTPHGAGLERYNLAVAGLDGAATVQGMRSLLDNLAYTRTYSTSEHAATDPRWDTEFVGTEGTDLTVSSPTGAFDTVQRMAGAAFLERDRNEPLLWQTVHSSVYDLEARSLHLVVQEDSGTVYYRSILP